MVLDYPDFESETSSAVWHDAMAETTPVGISSVTLLPLSSKYDIFSNFGEKDCGEPSKSQHIVIDFTPDPEIDNVVSQLKCCEFWDFINSKPYLKHLCVVPAQEQVTATEPTPVCDPTVLFKDNNNASSFISRNPHNFVELGLEGKMAASKCTLGDASYSEKDPTYRMKSSKLPVCKCSQICTKCKRFKPKPVQSRGKVKEMCKEFDSWDKQHPKLMTPPGPLMQYKPVLQRKLPPPQEPKTCCN